MRKTVVHAWTQGASNLPQTARANYWGIGDLLRGSNVLFEICKEIDADYVLDISSHPIGALFAGSQTDRSTERSVPFHAFKNFDDGKSLVKSLLDVDDRIIINTNGGPTWPEQSSPAWKELIKQAFCPTPEFEADLSGFIPKAPYSVMHFRLGDKTLVQKKSIAVDEAISIFSNNSDRNKVVISDSEQLKARLRLVDHDAYISEARTVHTGLAAGGPELSQTMADFFLISRATSVETYSAYPWPSGFIVAACRIYDVPFRCLSLEQEKPSRWRVLALSLFQVMPMQSWLLAIRRIVR